MIHGNFFKSRLGESIWPYMFNRAREIDPNAKYFVNNNITTLKEADDCVALVNWLRSQGVRVDGVGVHDTLVTRWTAIFSKEYLTSCLS